MAIVLFDTNIFIDMLNGVHQASIELGSYDTPAISFVTYMELRVGEYARPEDKPILDPLLAEFVVVEMSKAITEESIKIRGESLLAKPAVKLPDAIIAATAKVRGYPLITRNPKDFAKSGVIVHVPYSYDSKTGIVSNIQKPYKASEPMAVGETRRLRPGGPSLTRIR